MCQNTFFIKVQASALQKRDFGRGVFCSFAAFLETSILWNIYEGLLLIIEFKHCKTK